MPERTASLSARRERKNEVDMMSNCQPSLRAAASALGTFGLSMKPNRSRMRENLSLIGVICTRSAGSTRGSGA
jgi:hypothetical protein